MYRIGPSDFFTPGDLEADGATLDAQVATLDAELEGNEAIPQSFQDQWTVWKASWAIFYDDHFSGFFSAFVSSFNNSNRDDLIRYENQYAEYERRARELGSVVVAPVVPSTGTQDTFGDHLRDQVDKAPSILPAASSVVVIVVAIIVAIVVWKAR